MLHFSSKVKTEIMCNYFVAKKFDHWSCNTPFWRWQYLVSRISYYLEYVIFNPFYQIDDVTGANKENWCVFYFNLAWNKLTIEYLLFLGCWDRAKCASSLWLAALQRETEVTTAHPSPKMFRDIKWPIMSENSDVQCSGAWLRYVQKCMFNVQQHSIFNVKC